MVAYDTSSTHAASADSSISALWPLENGLGHMTLDAGGKGTFGIQFTEKYVARDKTKR